MCMNAKLVPTTTSPPNSNSQSPYAAGTRVRHCRYAMSKKCETNPGSCRKQTTGPNTEPKDNASPAVRRTRHAIRGNVHKNAKRTQEVTENKQPGTKAEPESESRQRGTPHALRRTKTSPASATPGHPNFEPPRSRPAAGPTRHSEHATWCRNRGSVHGPGSSG